ncbi:MAG: VWA domain-containing protein [Candidatus Scalindua sp.]|nr:VWA domain-containing protein [Candidatus Scalindua sp.]
MGFLNRFMASRLSYLFIIFLVALSYVSTNRIVWAEAEVYLADGVTPLSQAPELSDEKLPLLFVHGHNFLNANDEDFNFRKNWHDPHNGLPSFKLALDLPDNDWLYIEPYYIRFQNQKRSIVEDAGEIAWAVEHILHRHDSNYEPFTLNPSTNVKVVIIAFSKGTISSRLYLKSLQEQQYNLPLPRNGFNPVSEFIAISPPNHGFASSNIFTSRNHALSQLNNCKSKNCLLNLDCGTTNNFGEINNFIENLNGHPITDTRPDPTNPNWSLGEYPGEAPGSRRNNDSLPSEGTLYVTMYADNDENGMARDYVGGRDPSEDCQGRILARNLAPDAMNIVIPQIPNQPPVELSPLIDALIDAEDRLKFSVHQNSVHTPEVICNALYTAVRHQAPPEGFTCQTTGNNVPILPPPGIVLLFDTSGSMSWKHDGTVGVPTNEQRLTLAKNAAYPFMEMLRDHNEGKMNFGIATFPTHPWDFMAGCKAQEITPMTLVSDTSTNTAITNTISGLVAEGNTPLLAGISSGIGMFGHESKRAIVLLSDGYHNCPSRVDIGNTEVTNIINQLKTESIRVFTIGFGRPADIDYPLLEALASETGGRFEPVTTAANFDPTSWNPATALDEAYKSILKDALGLQTAVDPLGAIKGGEKVTRKVMINKNDKKVSFFLSWVTPRKGRLGFRVKSADGQAVATTSSTPGISFHEGETYKIITVDKSFLKLPGKVGSSPWIIEINAGDNVNNEKYQYSVIMDSVLEMNTTFDKKSYGTGDVITISATITEAGRPVSGLKDISVKVTRPEEGTGNWFALNKVNVDDLKKIPEKGGDESLSPLIRKGILLTEIRKIAFPAQLSPVTIQLYDDGKHGDNNASDGIYANQFPDTKKEGTYSFYFQATGTTMMGNAFEREDVVHKYINVNVTLETIEVSVVRLPAVKDTLNQFMIVITPKDALGNYLGPRYSKMIKLATSHGKFIDVLQNNLDGTYSQVLQLPTTVNIKEVVLKVDIKGETLPVSLVEKLEKSKM